MPGICYIGHYNSRHFRTWVFPWVLNLLIILLWNMQFWFAHILLIRSLIFYCYLVFIDSYFCFLCSVVAVWFTLSCLIFLKWVFRIRSYCTIKIIESIVVFTHTIIWNSYRITFFVCQSFITLIFCWLYLKYLSIGFSQPPSKILFH